LLVLVLGLMGVIALQMTTVKGNRASRMLDRAVELVAQEMEELRGWKTSDICPYTGTPSFPDVTTSHGVTYHRVPSCDSVLGQSTLKLVTATVTYPDDQDSTVTHTQTMQMVRTTVETL